MKYVVALLALCAASCNPVPAFGIEIDGDRIKATPAELQALAKCPEGGGCVLLTRQLLNQIVQMAMKAVADSPACRKDSI